MSYHRVRWSRLSLQALPLRVLLWFSPLVLLAACGGSSDTPKEPPTGFAVEAGDSQVTITWNPMPGLQYRVFRGRGSGITPQNWTTYPAADAIFPVNSPLVIAGLTNATQYSFNITAANDSPQGPDSGPIEATPRPAGGKWDPGPQRLANARLSAVAYNSTTWVTAGLGGAVFSSTNGIGWTARNSGLSVDLNAAAVAVGRFVVAGAGGAVASSTDLTNWTTANVGAGVRINGLAAGAGVVVAVGDGGAIYTSNNASDWTARTSGTTQDLYGVFNLNGTYTAYGAAGTLLTSTDQINWTSRASGVAGSLRASAYGGGTYAVFGDAGAWTSSTDAINWTARTAIGTENLLAATYVTQWVLAGSGGAVYTSADTAAWTRVSTGTKEDLFGVLWGNRRIVAVGAAGTNLTSD